MCLIKRVRHADCFFVHKYRSLFHFGLSFSQSYAVIALLMAENQESTSFSGQNPAPMSDTSRNTELVEQVFSVFKGYLTSQLKAKDKHLHEESKIVKEATLS